MKKEREIPLFSCSKILESHKFLSKKSHTHSLCVWWWIQVRCHVSEGVNFSMIICVA
jgi:hypothetical protein